MLVAIAFMALAIPILTASLSLAGTISKDSRVKTTILQGQYAAQGCTQYATYRLYKEPGYLNGLVLGVPDVYSFNGCTINVTKVSESQPLIVSFGDIVLTLDNSLSVNSSELDDLKTASNTIVDHFRPGMVNSEIRIGVSRFAVLSDSVVDSTDIDIHGDDGFVYVDDAFRSTNQPNYASGVWGGSSGQTGGGLRVDLGGIDDVGINDMSGGWQTTFTLTSAEEIELSFYYNMIQDEDYESDEYSEVIVTVDALQPGIGSNDYVARLTGNGSGGSEQTTGWQLFQTNLGTLNVGTHTLTIGGYNNKKNDIDEDTQVFVDDIKAEVVCTAACVPFLNATYDGDAEGALYADDTFRGTSQPTYASGGWGATYGQTGGGLRVIVGGINGNDILSMSGGWQTSFNLASQQGVQLSFDYNLTQASDYESDEYGEVIVTVDALQPGTGGNDYVARLTGDGNGGSPQTTGWQTFQVDLGLLSGGARTLTIGGYSNKKTLLNETIEVLVDNVVMTPTCIICTPLLDKNLDGNTPIHDGINSLVAGDPALLWFTNIVGGINGGANQFNTGLGDRINPPAPNIMIVITDGDDTVGNSDTDIETASANSGAEIFAIGVGSSVAMDTLNAIASEPDVDHVFTTSDYNAFLGLIDTLVAAVDAALDTGILVTIESVSPDGTINYSEVILPP